MTLNSFQYITASFFLALPVLLNLFIWQHPVVGMISGGIFVVVQSLFLAQAFKGYPAWVRVLGGAGILFLLFSLLQLITYLAFGLSKPFQAGIFLLLPVILAILRNKLGAEEAEPLDIHFNLKSLSRRQIVLFSLFIFTLSTLFVQLGKASTTDILLSPWNHLGADFWILYFILSAMVLAGARILQPGLLVYFMTAGHLLLSTSIAVIIYKLGYGFDPFLHQAAELAIVKEGAILPKTPYYLGQYSIVVGLHHLLGIAVQTIDRWLVPVLFSFALPLLLFFFDAKRTPLWLAIFVLAMPYGVFISSTPQALADLFFLTILLLAFPLLRQQVSTKKTLALIWSCAILALFTHPLAGIPSMLIAFALSARNAIRTWDRPVRMFFILLYSLISSLAIPAAFLIDQRLRTAEAPIAWKFNSIAESLHWLPVWPGQWLAPARDLFSQFGYLLGQSSILLAILLALITLIWLLDRGERSIASFYGGFALALAFGAVLLAGFSPFPSVIGYEQLDYPRRVFYLALLTLLPILMLGMIWLKQKLHKAPKSFSLFLILFLPLVFCSTLFVSYPRNSRHEIGRQYNVRAADTQTVRLLPPDQDFVVLANQSLSAAAIQEFGFARYYSLQNGEEAFFYSVPTSGTLYGLYLDMVYGSPTRDKALEAAKQAGVSTVHFILSDYWHNAEQLAQIASNEADERRETEGGKNMIFTYRFSLEELGF